MKIKHTKFLAIFFASLLICLLGYFLQPKILKGEAILTVANSLIIIDSQHINLYISSPNSIYNLLDILKIEKNKKNASKVAQAIALQKIDNTYSRISISGSSREEVSEIFSAIILNLKSSSNEVGANPKIVFLNDFFIQEQKFIGLFTSLFFSVILSLLVYFISEFNKND
jgi:hypothetical protein